MRIAGLELLDKFKRKHSDVNSQINAWICEVEDAKWRNPNDVKKRYQSASVLGDKRVVFNIKGNNYRIDTKIAYAQQVVFIKRIGTHAEYSKWQFD
jgi:mRNA interferase HigB